MDLNSVERVEEYLHIPQEPPAIVESNRPPAYWPTMSSDTLIHVKDLVIKYSPELPAVIHGISFDVRPREKIGTSLNLICLSSSTIDPRLLLSLPAPL